jgi:hypothetical protein
MPSPTKLVLVFEKAEDSACLQRIIADAEGLDVHAVFQDRSKVVKLTSDVNRREIATLLGQRSQVAENLLVSLAEKLSTSDTVTFTREELLSVLASAGEQPDKDRIDKIIIDVDAPGPFEEGATYADLEEAATQAASVAKIDPTGNLAAQEASGRPTLNIARVDEEVA